jgi:ATP-binding cassette subfamily A (ABC1) protein 3
MQDGGISVQDSLLCMLFGGCYLLVLGFFLEYNSPKEFGESFDLLAMCKKDKSFKASAEDVKRVSNGNWETRYTAENNVEPVASNLDAKEENKQFLMIEDLFKTYSNGHKALNGINLKIYQDQIFALLGQNGAGKTTFFSILTGLYQPSRGSGECLGNDLFKEMHKVRSSMGVCPQFDVMFELLTVEEHLDFFYELKCANPDKKVKSTEITKLMTDAGVIEKRSALVSHLSGGNRRKVSVCVSLCGNSKFVLLDEPTSGMDLGARRKMWNMLREYRRNRIICLTTHYMDEADVLGDRIGIMTAGQLSCLGSSMFLKKRFGKGYKIFIQKKLDANHNSSELLKYFHVKIGSDVVC